MSTERRRAMWCSECARFHVTCEGVTSEPGWNGKDGGCSRAVWRIGQLTLEDFP